MWVAYLVYDMCAVYQKHTKGVDGDSSIKNQSIAIKYKKCIHEKTCKCIHNKCS